MEPETAHQSIRSPSGQAPKFREDKETDEHFHVRFFRQAVWFLSGKKLSGHPAEGARIQVCVGCRIGRNRALLGGNALVPLIPPYSRTSIIKVPYFLSVSKIWLNSQSLKNSTVLSGMLASPLEYLPCKSVTCEMKNSCCFF